MYTLALLVAFALFVMLCLGTFAPERTLVPTQDTPVHANMRLVPSAVMGYATLPCQPMFGPVQAGAAQTAPTQAAPVETPAYFTQEQTVGVFTATLETLLAVQEAIVALTPAVEIDAEEIEAVNAQAVRYAVETTKIQHFASSTERMRAQRAANAAQGLTARGTTPQPPCNGSVKDPSRRFGLRDCKRKSVGTIPGWTKGGFCSYAHAAQYALERVWLGEETMEEFKARAQANKILHARIA